MTNEHREYRGWVIYRVSPSGYWQAWKSGYLRLTADTLAGLRALIRETEKSK
jgi:hypothetical protein